jgi:dihydrofolate reductase
MRKVIAAINMTLDGYCDHTAVTPDEEVHQHYKNLLLQADTILYGRITYQLMEFWRDLVENPSGETAMDEFAKVMNSTSKIVFSSSLKELNWHSASIAQQELANEVITLKKQNGKNIFVGSRSLINQLINLQLLDELQIMVHPLIAGKGLPLFEKLNGSKILLLENTKTFNCGAIILYYKFLNE